MTARDTPQLRRAALSLLGSPARQREFAGSLSYGEWEAVAILAGLHRLWPHLHGRIERGELVVEVPPHIVAHWRKAHREQALVALAQRNELFRLTEWLRERGMESVALKGSWLAWYAYPHAAERPLRDIDLLLPAGTAIAAWDALVADGFTPDEPRETDEVQARLAKHLPPLEGPAGVSVELHLRAWELAERMDWAMPPDRTDRIIASALPADPSDPCRYPSREAMLAHLVIHAVYSHRLDAGPLLLPDILFCAAGGVDWPALLEWAREDGWEEALALVLSLVDRWCASGLVGESGVTHAPPERVLEDAELLLVQDPRARKSAGIAMAVGEAWDDGGLAEVLRRLGERAAKLSPAKIAKRSYETARDFTSGPASEDARRALAIGRWLEGRE